MQKPWVSNKNRIKRLAYYKFHKSWKIHNWKSIIFSDESKFNLFHSDGRVKDWRQSYERYLPECTQKTIQGCGGSIMFWGCITYYKMGPLIEIKGNLNSQGYISQILEPLQQFWGMFRRRNKHALFMQDNAPAHSSKITERWFGLNKIRKLWWPPHKEPEETTEFISRVKRSTERSLGKFPARANPKIVQGNAKQSC